MRHVDKIERVMEAVAARIVALVEGRPAAGGKVVPLYCDLLRDQFFDLIKVASAFLRGQNGWSRGGLRGS
jgi:hypothetical protein